MTSTEVEQKNGGSLKEELRAYVVQHHSLFGDIVVPRSSLQSSDVGERAIPHEINLSPGGRSLSESFLTINEPWTQASTLDALNQMICTCQKCPLGGTRTNFVFGVGNPNADIVVIGEAPGADEDASGEPFIGPAGQLLNKILAAINLRRDEVFICNIIKCRPPGNRTPEQSEVEQCEPYLIRQLELIRPRFILALGLTAANTLLKKKAKMSELRGAVHDYHGIKVVVTYHPAALLRNAGWKRPTWEDVQMLRRLYDDSQTSSSTDRL